MTIERTDTELVIKLSNNAVGTTELQELIDYLRFKELTKNSTATQTDIDLISSEVNRNWWTENKAKYL